MPLNSLSKGDSARKEFEKMKREQSQLSNYPGQSCIDTSLGFDQINQSAISVLEGAYGFAIVIENYETSNKLTLLTAAKPSLLSGTEEKFTSSYFSNSDLLKKQLSDYNNLVFSAYIKHSDANKFADNLTQKSGVARQMIIDEIIKFMPAKFKEITIFSKMFSTDRRYLSLWDEDNSNNGTLYGDARDINSYKFLRLLNHYHGVGSLDRFFSYKWNRNHLAAVHSVLNSYHNERYVTYSGQQLNQNKQLNDLVRQLIQKIGDDEINPDGDLAKILRVVNYRTGCDYKQFLVAKKMTSAPSPNTRPIIPTFQL